MYDPVTRLEYRVEKLVCACSADHERDWPPCKVVFFGLATNALNVRNNYIPFCFYCFFWYPCMAINVSVQYNGGFLPDIIVLLTQCYFHRGTRLYVMKRFCICSL